MTTVLDRWSRVGMGTYAPPPVTLARGEGARVWDDTGREYLDLVAGIAVNALGHAHPAVVEAVSRQVRTLSHVSNLYASAPSVELAERLVALLGRPGRVFFCNSGAEANEAVFKMARRTGRPEIVAAEGSFHGRTVGALAMTGQPAKREPFLPLPGQVIFVPYGDVEALDRAVTGRTAAVLLEPVLGEGGVLPPPEGYLVAARSITEARGALLALDEVQTGIARTGPWFAHQGSGVAPDVVTLAKGLGGGLPLGACVAFGPAAQLLGTGQHGSTFGGNPIACAAALAVLATIEAEDLGTRAKTLGARLTEEILELGHPLVAGVRGAGLLLGIELRAPVAAAAESTLREAGFLVNAVAGDVIRLAPPLVLTDEQAGAFLTALPAALDRAAPPSASAQP